MRTSTQLAAMVAFLALGSYSAAAGEAGFLGGIDIGKNAARYEVRAGGAAYDVGPFTPDTFDGGVINGEVLAPSPAFLEGARSRTRAVPTLLGATKCTRPSETHHQTSVHHWS